MAQVAEKNKVKNYSTGKIYIEYGGREIEFDAYVGDNIVNIQVALEYNYRTGEIDIESIDAQMFDDDDNELDVSSLDLVIEVFEDQNVFGKAEMMMIEAEKDYNS